MSIFIPTSKQIMDHLAKSEDYPEQYSQIAFPRETAWGRLVELLTQ